MNTINHLPIDYAREINARLEAAREAQRRRVMFHEIKHELAWLFVLVGFVVWCVGLGCLIGACPNWICALGAGFLALLGLQSARDLLTRH